MEKAKPGLVRIMLTRKQQPTKSTFVRYENQCHQNGAVSFTSRPGTGRTGGWSVGRREASVGNGRYRSAAMRCAMRCAGARDPGHGTRRRRCGAACGQRTAVDDVDDSDRAREDGGSGGRVDDEGEVVEEPKQEEGGYRAPRWASRGSIQHAGATRLVDSTLLKGGRKRTVPQR